MLSLLNPVVRSADVYERIGALGERVGYDARLIYMLSGDITVAVDGGKPQHIVTGDLIFIPAGVPYRIKGKFLRMAVFTFDLTWSGTATIEKIPPVTPENFDKEKCNSTPIPPFDKPLRLEGLISEREEIARMCDIFGSAAALSREVVSARLKLLLLKIAELSDENALPVQMVEALDAYIRENVGDEISNTELGAIFGYHPYYASSLIKSRLGVTMRKYVIAHRLRMARDLLRTTDKSAGEIAECCGFGDSSYLAKSFKAAYGMTPKEYRNGFKDEFV